MNIVFVGTFGLKPKSSIGARAIPLAEALVDRGHSVTVLVPPYDNPADSGSEVTVGRIRVLNVSLPFKIPFLWYLVVTWRLLWLTLRLRPEVVHVFKPKGFGGFVASSLWLMSLLGITRIRVVVDTDDWEGVGGWNDIAGYGWALRLFFPLQEKWVLRQADAITVASRSLTNMVTGIRGKQDGVIYLPNAIQARSEIPRQHIDRQGLGLAGSTVILLYTRFFEFRVERVVEVLERVLSRLPGVKLLVVGKGLFGEERDLDRLAQEKGLVSRVAQVGWVDAKDLQAYFGAADVAIYPFDDTLINRTKCSAKLVELLGAGVPVVADRVGQNAEYIEHGKSGVLVDPGDVGAMAEAVVRLIQEPETARKIGRQAQERIKTEYNWERWSREAERAYEKAGEKESRTRAFLVWLAPALWMGFIFYLSSQPSLPQLPQPALQTAVAKLVHLGEYAVLSLLLFRACRLASFLSGSLRAALVFSVLVSALYAVSDEIHQMFVPNRHPAALDILVDTAGACLGLGLLWWRKRFTKKIGYRRRGRGVNGWGNR